MHEEHFGLRLAARALSEAMARGDRLVAAEAAAAMVEAADLNVEGTAMGLRPVAMRG
jgi:hypothetical protein